MNILALETATDYCSVALSSGGDEISDYNVSGKGVHSEAIFSGIEFVLNQKNIKPSDLDVILLSEGPGSYTGLRIGYSAAKGLLFGHQTKFYTVNTMLSIAAGVSVNYTGYKELHIVLDARRNHLIHQSFIYKSGLLIPQKEINIVSINDLRLFIAKDDILAGTGIHRIKQSELPGVRIIPDFPVEAGYMFLVWKMQIENPERVLMKESDPAGAEPIYLTPGI